MYVLCASLQTEWEHEEGPGWEKGTLILHQPLARFPYTLEYDDEEVELVRFSEDLQVRSEEAKVGLAILPPSTGLKGFALHGWSSLGKGKGGCHCQAKCPGGQ